MSEDSSIVDLKAQKKKEGCVLELIDMKPIKKVMKTDEIVEVVLEREN
jgi:hypothetical protein